MSTTVRELMLSGAHFGHRTRFWNPKMRDYIYCTYHKTHVINLDITLQKLVKAAAFVESVAESGGTVLYVCTKRAAAESVKAAAKMSSSPFISQRWLGGTLTNFQTTCNSVKRLVSMEADIASGVLDGLTKKEGIKFVIAKDNLERNVGGIREMKTVPDAMFVIDAGWHQSAIREANKIGIPVIAVVDTNHSPRGIDVVIPGNDDSREAIQIYLREISEAIIRGKEKWQALAADETDISHEDTNDNTAYVSANKEAEKRPDSDQRQAADATLQAKRTARVVTAKKTTTDGDRNEEEK